MRPCSDNPRTRNCKASFGQLAQVEVRHEQRLFEVYGQVAPGGQDLATFESAIVPKALEGGFNAQEFLETNKAHLQTAPRCSTWP